MIIAQEPRSLLGVLEVTSMFPLAEDKRPFIQKEKVGLGFTRYRCEEKSPLQPFHRDNEALF